MVVFPKNKISILILIAQKVTLIAQKVNESSEIKTKVVLVKALFWGSGKNKIHHTASWRLTAKNKYKCFWYDLRGEFLAREKLFA